MKILNHAVKLITLISIIILMSACTQVTQDNYNKIQVGMTMSQVTAILGPPSSTESVNFLGFSGSTAVWKTQSTEITILFFNDKVQVKGLKQIQNLNPRQNQFQVPFNKVGTTS